MTHVVQQGECISSIAEQYGLSWEKVWNHGDNLQLRSLRKDPNVLYPGDEVALPERETKTISKGTEQRHRFMRKGAAAKLKLRLLDEGRPRSYLPYQLEIEGRVISGTTDGDGFLEHLIPPTARHGRITAGSGATRDVYDLDFGVLDPLSTEEGVAGRLTDLGYAVDNPTEAVKAFQQDEGLTATGEADSATRTRLKEKFGQ